MKKILLSIFVLTSFIFISCAGAENSNDNKEIVNGDHTSKSDQFDSPCEIISIEDVKKVFNLDGSTEITIDNTQSSFPTCRFKWIGVNKIDVFIDSELLIVMVENAHERMYTQSTASYSDAVDVSDVGEMAVWSDKRDQLTFLSNKYLFHVHARASNDDAKNKDDAITIANMIISQL